MTAPSSFTRPPAKSRDSNPMLGRKVRHPTYGTGTVVGVEGDDDDRSDGGPADRPWEADEANDRDRHARDQQHADEVVAEPFDAHLEQPPRPDGEIARQGIAQQCLFFGKDEIHQSPSTALAMMLRWISLEPP